MPEPMNVYKQAAVVINDTQLKCVETIAMNQRIEHAMNRSGASPWVSYASGRKRIPLCSFETYDIAGLLGLTALSILGIGTGKTADFYFATRSHGSHNAATSVHLKYSLNHGVVVPRRFSVDGRGEVKATADVIACYDGTHNPIVLSSNNALPSGSGIACNKYTCGPWKIGTTLYDTMSSEIDCGIQEFTDGKSGEPYDRFACMDTQELKASTRMRDLTISDVISLDGSSLATTIFFQKLLAGSSTRVAYATAEHISVKFTSSMVYPTSTDGSGAAASQGVEALAVWNGTQAIGIVSTAAAIA